MCNHSKTFPRLSRFLGELKTKNLLTQEFIASLTIQFQMWRFAIYTNQWRSVVNGFKSDYIGSETTGMSGFVWQCWLWSHKYYKNRRFYLDNFSGKACRELEGVINARNVVVVFSWKRQSCTLCTYMSCKMFKCSLSIKWNTCIALTGGSMRNWEKFTVNTFKVTEYINLVFTVAQLYFLTLDTNYSRSQCCMEAINFAIYFIMALVFLSDHVLTAITQRLVIYINLPPF
jgi:hypothetical protein